MSSLDEPESGPLFIANPSVPVFGDLRTANLAGLLGDQQPVVEEASTAPQHFSNLNTGTAETTETTPIEEDILSTAGSNSFLTTVRKSWNIGELIF
jgi:hypothetical protein